MHIVSDENHFQLMKKMRVDESNECVKYNVDVLSLCVYSAVKENQNRILWKVFEKK